MGAMASQITSLTIVYSTVYSGADQRKHQSSASLAFVRGIHRWPVNSPHKWPVTRKRFPFDDVIMRNINNKNITNTRREHKWQQNRYITTHDDVMTWKCSPHYWVCGTHRPPVDSPQNRTTNADLWCFYVVSTSKLLIKLLSCRLFKIPWRSGDVTVINSMHTHFYPHPQRCRRGLDQGFDRLTEGWAVLAPNWEDCLETSWQNVSISQTWYRYFSLWKIGVKWTSSVSPSWLQFIETRQTHLGWEIICLKMSTTSHQHTKMHATVRIHITIQMLVWNVYSWSEGVIKGAHLTLVSVSKWWRPVQATGAPLATMFNWIRAWMTNYIYSFIWNIITRQCPYFSGGLMLGTDR